MCYDIMTASMSLGDRNVSAALKSFGTAIVFWSVIA